MRGFGASAFSDGRFKQIGFLESRVNWLLMSGLRERALEIQESEVFEGSSSVPQCLQWVANSELVSLQLIQISFAPILVRLPQYPRR